MLRFVLYEIDYNTTETYENIQKAFSELAVSCAYVDGTDCS